MASFARYTSGARRVLVFAQNEARTFHHGEIRPEHLLLGLIAEGEGVAGLALKSSGATLDAAHGRMTVAFTPEPQGPIPFSQRARRVLEMAASEASRLSHNYIGTEHLLLGYLGEADTAADGDHPWSLLARLQIPPAALRDRILGLLAGYEAAERPAAVPDPPPDPVPDQIDAIMERLDVIERHLGIVRGDKPEAGG